MISPHAQRANTESRTTALYLVPGIYQYQTVILPVSRQTFFNLVSVAARQAA